MTGGERRQVERLKEELEKPKSLEEQITTLIGAIAEATVNASNVLNQGMGALARTSGQAAENIERAGEVVLNLEEYRTELLKEIARVSKNKAVLAGEVEVKPLSPTLRLEARASWFIDRSHKGLTQSLQA